MQQNISRLLLVFGICFAVLMMGPDLLQKPFFLMLLMKEEDVAALFKPLVLIPLYWLLFKKSSQDGIACQRDNFISLIFAILWIEGFGLNLASNSIYRLIQDRASDLAGLTYFFDEVGFPELSAVGLI